MSKVDQVEKLSQMSVHEILGHNLTARSAYFLAGKNIFLKKMPEKWFGTPYQTITDSLFNEDYHGEIDPEKLFSLGELAEEVRHKFTHEPTGYYALYDKKVNMYLSEDLGSGKAKYWSYDVNKAKLYTNLNELVNIIAEVGDAEETIIISPKGV